MSLNGITDRELQDALRPHRVEPEAFESAVRERLARIEADPLTRLSPWLRSAAALFPLPLLTGGKLAATGAKLTPLGSGAKLLGYLSLPAFSIFVLLGAALISTVRIRRLRREHSPAAANAEQTREALKAWWREHWWIATPVYLAALILPAIGSGWLLLVVLLVSMATFLFVLTALSKALLGSRPIVGQTCYLGILYLAIGMGNYQGRGELHFLDPALSSVALFTCLGVLFLLQLMNHPPRLRRFWWASILIVAAGAWRLGPTLFPVGNREVLDFIAAGEVEPGNGVSWRNLEMSATSARAVGLEVDLTAARAALAAEIEGPRSPFALSSAARLGLFEPTGAAATTLLSTDRRSLFDWGYPDSALTSLGQRDWLIRLLALSGDLSEEQRDGLAKRLHATWRREVEMQPPHDILNALLQITRLLDVLGRPIEIDARRAEVHDWLRRCFSEASVGFTPAGGFRAYPGQSGPSLPATWQAIQLMKIYGVPADLEANWVRSFLSPWNFTVGSRRFVAAAAREEVAALPGLTAPTWLELLAAERVLIAVLMLALLCLYATVIAPKPRPHSSEAESALPRGG